MIATLLATQIARKRRLSRFNQEDRTHSNVNVNSKRASFAKSKLASPRKNIDRVSLLRRYMQLLKTTMISFVLSTMFHIGVVSTYYYTFLWLNPDDPGKKKFYSTTSVSPGVNIGGRVIGGGGIQTNHHKSYFFHLIREHYKGLSNMFFIQFSAIYLVVLFVFKFFPERAKLKEDTEAAFNLSSKQAESESTTEQLKASKSNKLKPRTSARKRVLIKRASRGSNVKREDLIEEEIMDEVDIENEQDNESLDKYESFENQEDTIKKRV